MKNILLFFFWVGMFTTAYADNIVLDNQVATAKRSKIAIQWAASTKEVEANNLLIKEGKKLNPHSLKMLSRMGVLTVDIPKDAEYFRVLVWSNKTDPDFLTNWVDIVPKKRYTLNKDFLIPFVLVSGMGC